MRVKKLLTAALCAVLAVVSCNMSSLFSETKLNIARTIVYAASDETEDDEEISVTATTSAAQTGTTETSTALADTSKADVTETNVPQTNAPETNSSQTNATETSVPETSAPQTNAAETSAPETSAPQTNATETGAPETSAPQTNAAETGATETSAPTTEGQTTKPTESQTQTSTEAGSESVTQGSTEHTGTEQLPAETTPGTEVSAETVGTEAGLPGETLATEEAQSEAEKKKKKKKETESESESETSLYDSNEELIRHQNIVRPDDIVLEFRFTQVEAEYAIVQNRDGISIYESRSEDAEAVGELTYYGVCCILEDCEDGWYYVESGDVRGFARAEEFAIGEVAQRIVNVKGLEELPEALLLTAHTENDAYTYTHTTVQEVIAEKVYAIAEEEVEIYEQRKSSADVVGVLEEGALCYILADEEEEWVYVESGNARGFAAKDKLITGKKAEDMVEEIGEDDMMLAEVKIDPEDNDACYYTLTSVKEASESAKLREDIVNYALNFLGNPYVWGGTSLTDGADCSGFVQSIYAHFGYYLPRVAEAQSVYGMQIPIDSAAPGDLIFYARNGYVYHVSMYIGNGQVVHAAGRKVGIITSGIAGNAVWATRIITD